MGCYFDMSRLIIPLLLLFVSVIHAELVLVYTINRHGARNVLRKDANLTESDANAGPTLLPQGRAQVNAAGTAFRRRYIDPATCNTTCLASANATLYGVFGTPSTGFTNYNTLVRSSGLDRAVLSANGFMAGVFPPVLPANATAALTAASYANSQVAGGWWVGCAHMVECAHKYIYVHPCIQICVHICMSQYTHTCITYPSITSPTQPVPVYNTPDSEDMFARAYTRCPVYQRRLDAWFTSDEFLDKVKETQAFR